MLIYNKRFNQFIEEPDKNKWAIGKMLQEKDKKLAAEQNWDKLNICCHFVLPKTRICDICGKDHNESIS